MSCLQARNCGELLRLYVSHGLLEDAVRLAIQYLDGVLGQGTRQVRSDVMVLMSKLVVTIFQIRKPKDVL